MEMRISKIKSPIKDHGIISDLRTYKLAANDGASDHLC